MELGSLDQLITIQRRQAGRDAIGQPLDTWVAHAADVWADVRYPPRGSEDVKAGGPASTVQPTMRIHAREGITNAMRVLYDGQVYEILAVRRDSRRVWLFLDTEIVT